IIVFVQRDAVRLLELCFLGWATIAAEAWRPCAYQSGNQARVSLDPADHMRIPLGNQHVAFAIKANFMGCTEPCQFCGTAVTGMALFPIACNHRHMLRLAIKHEYAVA